MYYVSKENNNGMRLCILADGMGGYKGGEIASSLATSAAKLYIEEKFKYIDPTVENIQDLIKKAMEYANEVICEKAKTNEELEQMGTTLEICIMYGNKVYIGHIGDSRIYRIRKNIIRRITTDHSYVETLVKDGTITREEAFYHPRKNMLMKALGCTPFVEPDVTVKGFIKDDTILICSDGLTNMVPIKDIQEIIEQEYDTLSDDEKLIRDVIKEYCFESKYEVIEAENGLEAINKAGEADVIIMDIIIGSMEQALCTCLIRTVLTH